MPIRLIVLFVFVLGAGAATDLASAQQRDTTAVADTPERRIVLIDGSVLVGTVLAERADALVIRTQDGLETTVPRARIREVGPLLERGFKRYDPTGTRLFLAPTGRTLAGGSGRLSGYYLFPSVAYGVTDRLDVSLGSTIPAPEIGTIMAFNVKGQVVATERVQVALGGNAFVPVGGAASLGGTAGTVYGVVTAGDPTSAATLGLFGVYASDFTDVDVGEGALVLAAYERQVSNSVKLLTENYVLIAAETLGGGALIGVRFFGDRLAADLAVALGWGGGEIQTIPVPYVGFSYTFGP